MSRHRGVKQHGQYGLSHAINLLSLAYLLFLARYPVHVGVPGHYILLAYLLDLYVCQSDYTYTITFS